MTRIALTMVLMSAAIAPAQDMPLSMFVRAGETWTPADGDPTEPAGLLIVDPPEYKITATVVSPDGGTLYVGYENRNAVWAMPAKFQGDITGGGLEKVVQDAPYCPLRLKAGAKSLAVTALTRTRPAESTRPRPTTFRCSTRPAGCPAC